MKYTLPNGAVVEGSLEEIQSIIGQASTAEVKREVVPTEPPKKTGTEKMTELLASCDGPVTVSYIRSRTNWNSKNIMKTVKKIGAVVLDVQGPRKVTHVIIPPHLTQGTCNDAAGVLREGCETVARNDGNIYDGITYEEVEKPAFVPRRTVNAPRMEKIAAILQRDGFITRRQIKDITTSNDSIFNWLKRMLKAYPGSEVFALKRNGLYLEGFDKDLRKASKMLHSASAKIRPESEYNKFMRERMNVHFKQGIPNAEAFKMAVVEWNARKSGGKQVSASVQTERPLDDDGSGRPEGVSERQETTENAADKRVTVYLQVLRALEARGYRHYTMPWLDALGTQLKERGSITWNYKNMYINEGEWNTVVSMILLDYARKLLDVWNISGKLVWESGILCIK